MQSDLEVQKDLKASDKFHVMLSLLTLAILHPKLWMISEFTSN